MGKTSQRETIIATFCDDCAIRAKNARSHDLANGMSQSDSQDTSVAEISNSLAAVTIKDPQVENRKSLDSSDKADLETYIKGLSKDEWNRVNVNLSATSIDKCLLPINPLALLNPLSPQLFN